MKLKELYNNAVLSLIASCLLALVYNQKTICIMDRGPNIIIPKMATIPVNDDGSINVKIVSSDVIDVNIENISTRDKLNVNISELGGGFVRYNGPLNVKIDN